MVYDTRGGIIVPLDRALGTQAWVDLFPCFWMHYLNKTLSDHVPILLTWEGGCTRRGKKPFRYEEIWNMQEGCDVVVQQGWEHSVGESSIYQVTEKIKATRMALNNWARNFVRVGPKEIRELKDKLTILLGQPFTNELIEQKKVLIGRLNHLPEQDELLWR